MIARLLSLIVLAAPACASRTELIDGGAGGKVVLTWNGGTPTNGPDYSINALSGRVELLKPGVWLVEYQASGSSAAVNFPGVDLNASRVPC